MLTALSASSKTAHMSIVERPLFDEMSLIVRVIWLAECRSLGSLLRHSRITARRTARLSAYKVLRASVVAASWRLMHLSYIQVSIATGDHASPGSGKSLEVDNLGMPESSHPPASVDGSVELLAPVVIGSLLLPTRRGTGGIFGSAVSAGP